MSSPQPLQQPIIKANGFVDTIWATYFQSIGTSSVSTPPSVPLSASKDVQTDASGFLVSVDNTGTNNNVMSTSPTFDSKITVTTDVDTATVSASGLITSGSLSTGTITATDLTVNNNAIINGELGVGVDPSYTAHFSASHPTLTLESEDTGHADGEVLSTIAFYTNDSSRQGISATIQAVAQGTAGSTEIVFTGYRSDDLREFLSLGTTGHLFSNGNVTISDDLTVNDITAADVTINGLTTTNGGIVRQTVRVTTTYTVLSTDYTIYANTDSGDWTLSLPSGIEGAEYEILLTGASGNTLTISPNGTDKLFGFNDDFNAYDFEGFTIKYNSTDGWR